MSDIVRQRLSRGVSYNMKIVVRGARRSGKTSLWRRLQAGDFSEAYEATPEIQTANIDWKPPKSQEDMVKVEVWDVVDHGFHPDGDGLRNRREADVDADAPAGLPQDVQVKDRKEDLTILDASVVDVYKDCQCAIVCVHPGDGQQSWEYAHSLLKDLPSHVCALLMLNFQDLRSGSDAWVSREDVMKRVKALDPTGERIFVCEASMKNCFGLRALYNWLSVPFYHLKRDTLMKQAEIVRFVQLESIRTSQAELDALDFAKFTEGSRLAQAPRPNHVANGQHPRLSLGPIASQSQTVQPQEKAPQWAQLPKAREARVEEAPPPIQPKVPSEAPSAMPSEARPPREMPLDEAPSTIPVKDVAPAEAESPARLSLTHKAPDVKVSAQSEQLGSARALQQTLDDFFAETDDEEDQQINEQRAIISRHLKVDAYRSAIARKSQMLESDGDYSDDETANGDRQQASGSEADWPVPPIASIQLNDDDAQGDDAPQVDATKQLEELMNMTFSRPAEADSSAGISDAARAAIAAAFTSDFRGDSVETSTAPKKKKKKKEKEKKADGERKGKKKKKKRKDEVDL
eukprot:scaffold848_cov247-Pinguiococcus_pyrenoidosus.AAC.20